MTDGTITIDTEELKKRARTHWFRLTWVALFIWLDFLIHRDLVTVVLAVAAVALVLFPAEIIDYLKIRQQVEQLGNAIPVFLRPYLPAVPGFAYFLLRGQGTSQGAGLLGFLAAIVTIILLERNAPKVDSRITGLYKVRNQLPPWVRMILGPIGAIVLAFAIIHGNLNDIPAMFGGTTTQPRSPYGLELQFMISGVVSSFWGWVLFHQPAGEAEAAPRPAKA